MAVTVEQVRIAARTTPGTQDFTFSGFGTVKAAIIEVTWAVADDTPIARAFYSYGIVDGTSQYCASLFLEDNVAPAFNGLAETGSDQAYTSNTKCVALLDSFTPALVAVATFDSFIADGVRITWTTAPSAAVLVRVTLLGGSSLSVHAGHFTSTSVVDTATVISSVPFLADQVILVGNHRLAFDSFAWPHAVPNSAISIGFADRGATIRQCCLAQYGDCSQPLSETAGQVSSLYAAYGVLTSQGIELTDFTSSGFSAYVRESADFGGGFVFFYLALKYDDQPHWVGVIDSPTTTGNISEASPDITPIAFMQLCSGINISNVPRSQNGVGAGGFGSVTCTANDLFTHGFSGAHGVNPQNTESWSSDALRSRLSTQSDLHVASFVSFDTLGYTLNYSTANGTVRKWPTLVIGRTAAAAASSTPARSGVMAWIKSAIVEILEENAEVNAWATGGIHARRAPALPNSSPTRRRDKYIVVRVSNSDPNDSHTQGEGPQRSGAATVTTDTIDVSIWASSSRDADEGANRVRRALDGMTATAADIVIQRIFWRGTVDREVEDASGAEQLIDGCHAEFDVGYVLPT